MQLSPLHLEGYYIKAFSFSIAGDADDKMLLSLPGVVHVHPAQPMPPQTLSVDVGTGFAQNTENPRRFKVIVAVSSKEVEGQSYPYKFSVVIVGYFLLAEGITPQVIETLLSSTAPGMLYTLAREYTASATGRGPFPAAVLPSIMFPASKVPPEILKGEFLKTVESSPSKAVRKSRKFSSKKKARKVK